MLRAASLVCPRSRPASSGSRASGRAVLLIAATLIAAPGLAGGQTPAVVGPAHPSAQASPRVAVPIAFADLDAQLARAQAAAAAQPPPLRRSAEGATLIPGFGYTPPTNACSCVWRDSVITPSGGQPTDCWQMDLSADPFPSRPGSTQPADYVATVRRYHLHAKAVDYYPPGEIPAGEEILVKGYIPGYCDAENWLTTCAESMRQLCLADAFGTAATHDCTVDPNNGITVRELTDYLVVSQQAGSCPSTFTAWFEVGPVFVDGFEQGTGPWDGAL